MTAPRRERSLLTARLRLATAFTVALFAIGAPAGGAPGPRPHATTSAPVPTRHRAAAVRPGHRVPSRPARVEKSASRDQRARVSIGGGGLRPLGDPRRRSDVPLSLEERTAERIDELLRGPLRSGTTALYVVDARSGTELFSVHPDDALNPASNVKLIATATALDILGADYQYATRLVGRMPSTSGEIAGDVYLLGSYDPTLGRADLDALARDLAAGGVHRIAGDIVVGATPTRDGMYRAAVKLDIRAGALGQAPTVEVVPAYDFVTVDVKATTSKRRRAALRFRDELITDEHGHQRLRITVEGDIQRGRALAHWTAPRERGLHTAHLLRASLRAAGIDLVGDARVSELPAFVATAATTGWLPIELAVHRSAPLADIIARVNKRSINWLADRVVMTAAAARFHEAPSMPRAVDAMYEWLEAHTGLTRKDVVIDTGSGLSYRTAVSARQLVSVLRSAGSLGGEPGDDDARMRRDAYLASLAVGGIDGTLRRRFLTPTLQGHLRAKTGTLRRVVALSGLLEPTPGHALAFALVSNGHPPAYKARVRAAHEKLISILYDYLVATGAAPATPVAASAAVSIDPATPVPSVTSSSLPGDDPSLGDEETDEAEVGSDPTADQPTAP